MVNLTQFHHLYMPIEHYLVPGGRHVLPVVMETGWISVV